MRFWLSRVLDLAGAPRVAAQASAGAGFVNPPPALRFRRERQKCSSAAAWGAAANRVGALFRTRRGALRARRP